jgi:PAS domain S-box-containing protein
MNRKTLPQVELSSYSSVTESAQDSTPQKRVGAKKLRSIRIDNKETIHAVGYGIISDTANHTPEDIRQIAEQVEWYRTAFEQAPDALLIIQANTWSILDANKLATSLFSKEYSQLIGCELPQVRELYKTLLKSYAQTTLDEITFRDNESGERRFEVSGRLLSTSDTNTFAVSLRDVTTQRELIDRSHRDDKLSMLGQLSASIAHEIRNPLAAVNLNLQLLKRKCIGDESLETNISTALRGVERMINIVNTTLNFAKPVAPQLTAIDIHEVILTALDAVSTQFQQKFISVEIDVDDDFPLLRADSIQLHQVFVNLLSNACDAIVANGTIRISSSVFGDGKDSYGILNIHDTGVGISNEDVHRIFEPFFTRKAEGTGLGLAIIHRIIQQHGGEITVETTEGKGSTFSIKLPFA